jgi:putative endonuclease
MVDGFTKRYGVHMLVYYENTDSVTDALVREKELKKWGRSKKIALVEGSNPHWNDLYERLCC